MTDPLTPEGVLERLGRVLSTTTLPLEAHQTAGRLIDRLSSPVRVTLLGPGGAGKSTLSNMLLGTAIIPDDTELPTTELRFGDTEKIVATLGNKSTKDIPGLDFAALSSSSAAFAEIQTSLPILKRISILEVVTDGSSGELLAATKWAAQRTDIAIWVTADFGLEEQALWAKLPDELKDHGFLVLNQLDKLSPEDRVERAKRLKLAAAKEFLGIFPTVAKQGLAAVENADARDEKAFNSSGCQRLQKALMRHVDLGTQADIDGALLFLNRYEPPAAKAAPTTAEARPATSGTSGVGQTEPADKTNRASETLNLENIAADAPAPDQESQRGARELALSCIGSGAELMLEELAFADAPAADRLLEQCCETIDDLATTLSDADPLLEPVMQASDAIVLLQLESSDTAAEDAVVALLQLKRDIEVALAA